MHFVLGAHCRRADGQRQRTLDLRLRHGIHALEMHLRFADLDRVGGKLRADAESFRSSLGRIVRIAWYEVERKGRGVGELQTKRADYNGSLCQTHEGMRSRQIEDNPKVINTIEFW